MSAAAVEHELYLDYASWPVVVPRNRQYRVIETRCRMKDYGGAELFPVVVMMYLIEEI